MRRIETRNSENAIYTTQIATKLCFWSLLSMWNHPQSISEWFMASTSPNTWLCNIDFLTKCKEISRVGLVWTLCRMKTHTPRGRRPIKVPEIDSPDPVDDPRYSVYCLTPPDGWDPHCLKSWIRAIQNVQNLLRKPNEIRENPVEEPTDNFRIYKVSEGIGIFSNTTTIKPQIGFAK